MTRHVPTVTAETNPAIPPLTHTEAGVLAQEEYGRLLAILEQLEGDDWNQPTYCTEWNVRQMVAHLAGAVTGSTTLREFLRQNMVAPVLSKDRTGIDATNALQVSERADKTTDELVGEFRRNGQIAINNRRSLPWWVRKIHLPMGPLGVASIEYLMNTIYPRDMWMHRYDLCVATGKQMVVTPEHDGRIVALVVRDIARKLNTQLSRRSVMLRLVGALHSQFLLGRSATPGCVLKIDVFDFNLRASGRISAAEAAARAHVDGDPATATWFLENMEVVY